MRPLLLALVLLNGLVASLVVLISTVELDGVATRAGQNVDVGPDAVIVQERRAAVAVPTRSVVTPDEMIRRPLFAHDRRTPKVVVPLQAGAAPRPPAETQPPLREDVRLIGVASIGDRRKALFRFGDDPQGRWLELGASVNGWRLMNVSSTTATLQANGQTLTLRTTTDKATSQANVPAVSR